jgi:hypothetical protein
MLKKIRTHDQLHKVFNAMAAELVEANCHFTLLVDLTKMHKRYWREFSQSPAFWHLTRRAHQDAVVLRLCKAYSQDLDSVNLRTFLKTIEANRQFFDADHFRERLRTNPHVESLAADPRHPTPARLRRDLNTVLQESQPRVRNLMMWRHKYYAHRDPSKIINDVVLGRDYPLTFTDIRWLLRNALRIVNHYSGLYLAMVNARTLVGQDDYRNVLTSVRDSLRAQDARLAQEIRAIRRQEPVGQRRSRAAPPRRTTGHDAPN